MWREGYEVGPRAGLKPGTVLGVEASALAEGDEAALATAMEGHGATYASMLQDLERGVPTEVDVIVGAVVERGREHDVPTPLHARVVRADPRSRARRAHAVTGRTRANSVDVWIARQARGPIVWRDYTQAGEEAVP